MSKLFKRRKKKVGLPPGSLEFLGEAGKDPCPITILDYDKDKVHQINCTNITEAFPFHGLPSTTWINVGHLDNVEPLKHLGKQFGIHDLALEDILNTDQRPKAEDYGPYLFLVMRVLTCTGDEINNHQLSLIVGQNEVITFEENSSTLFEDLRKHVHQGGERLRGGGPDYLTYRVMDTVVDNYFVVLETLSERIEDIEKELLDDPDENTLKKIHALKRDIIFCRKQIWPLRDVFSTLQRQESPVIAEHVGVYLRDVYDHLIQVVDTLDSFRDLAGGMFDMYMSQASHKMNEVMKVLTVIATIFIPLTFITGLYGMNFHTDAGPLNMPELDSPFGYPAVILLMTGVFGMMLLYFKRKKWF